MLKRCYIFGWIKAALTGQLRKVRLCNCDHFECLREYTLFNLTCSSFPLANGHRRNILCQFNSPRISHINHVVLLELSRFRPIILDPTIPATRRWLQTSALCKEKILAVTRNSTCIQFRNLYNLPFATLYPIHMTGVISVRHWGYWKDIVLIAQENKVDGVSPSGVVSRVEP